MSAFVAGQRIRYTDRYLHSIHADRHDDWWGMHGTVIRQTAWVVTVRWDGWDRESAVVGSTIEVV